MTRKNPPEARWETEESWVARDESVDERVATANAD